MGQARLWANYEQRMRRVIDYVHRHLADDLDLNQLADIACLSPYHWHRVYRAMRGETIFQTVTRLRCARAARDLIETSDDLEHIAKRYGFGSARAFSRSFGALYAMTPRAYRDGGQHVALKHAKVKEDMTMFDVDITETPARTLHGFSHRGDYMNVSQAFEKAFGRIAASNLLDQMGGMVGIYYDDPSSVPVEDLRSFGGVELAAGVAAPADLETRQIDAGTCAVMHYKGPYAEMKAAYEWLYGVWLPQVGRELRDAPPFEIYLNNPETTPPHDLLTDIHMPLK